MMKNIIYSILSTFAALLLTASCTDDRGLFWHEDVGEGEALLTAEISFKDYTPALTRTTGNALNGIENLFVLIYTANGTLFDVKEYSGTQLNLENNNVPPSDGVGVDADELPTKKARVNLTLPYGKYQIYAVANMRGDYASILRDKEGTIKNVEGLKSIQVQWDSQNISNDDQMFGYFMELTGNQEVPSSSKGFGPNIITINQSNQRISTWLRRLASKVTVAYDGSGLNEGVWIYIKNVTVHDIASKCYLGKDNKPSSTELLNRREGNNNNPTANYSPSVQNTRIVYEKQSSYIYDNSQTGLEIYNGMTVNKGSDHGPNANALFFYENMQGDYSDDLNKNDYDKRQYGSGKDKVGDNIRQPDGENDYKDRVEDGTYIEVEAYYVSINPANPSSGNIKYRFMLGKDITYNYDVERNYHFKLTLGFKGWANQPDWHIDYDIPDPMLDVQPVVRVSYLYHQKSYLPVKIGNDCTKLTVEIIENNWAPTNPDDDQFPSNNPVVSNPETYEFKWNKPAFESLYYKGVKIPELDYTYNSEKPYLGFLALNMPDEAKISDLPTSIPVKEIVNGYTNYWSFSERENGQNALRDFYNSKYGQGTQAMSTFEGKDLEISELPHRPSGEKYDLNSWMVNSVDDGTDKGNKIVMIPLWTRAKTMIEGSGFSGNNPYEYFVRRATLKVTAEFKDKDPVIDYVTVYQEPRIVNPKAIWRASGTNGDFHVRLMTAQNSNLKSDYLPLSSDGAWTASVEVGNNVTLALSNNSNATLQDGEIHGKTGTNIDFNININGDGNAIISVLYHNNNCVHKIFVKQGYEQDELLGGKYWSNYALFSATAVTGQNYNYTGTFTTNPFYLGSYFRRGRITEGILETNNDRTNFKPFVNPGSTRAYNLTTGQTKTWTAIGCEDNNTNPAAIGVFRINGRNYKVPELADFNALKANCEFALGIIYGNASETSDKFTEATGFSATNPNYGVRGVIAYDAVYGNQVLFSLGKEGYGRRDNTYYWYGNGGTTDAYGTLMYSDVYCLLSDWATNNAYRPVPYNLKIYPGVIYWLNNRVADGFLGATSPGATMSWDVNYFNYDFNSFDNRTAGNHRDALPIKLVRQ